MHSNQGLIVCISTLSHPGMLRRSQEDALLAGWHSGPNGWQWTSPGAALPLPRGGILLAVADGMGGLNAGELASALALQAVEKNFRHFGEVEAGEAAVLLRQAIINAHISIEAESRKPGQGEMGSTLVLAWLLGESLHVAWVGDSRCYRFRPGQGLEALTRDHSLVQQLIDEGAISEEQAFDHPRRNVITQSLGIRDHDPAPDYACHDLRRGDLYLLCSDGLNSMLRDEVIAAICERFPEPAQCAAELVAAANEAGGHDNISVVVAAIPAEAAPDALLAVATSPDAHEKAMPGFLAQTPGSDAPKVPQGKAGRPAASPRYLWLMLLSVAALALLTALAVLSGRISRETPPGGKLQEAPAPPQDGKAGMPGPATEMPEAARDSSPGFLPPSLRGRFVLVADSFAGRLEAEALQRRLQDKFPHALVGIAQINGLYEVRISGFETGQAAEEFKKKHPMLKKGIVLITPSGN